MKIKTWINFSISIIPVFIGCLADKNSDFPYAAIIVGDVELIRKGKSVPIGQNQFLRAGDTVKVKEKSKVKFILPGGASWYLNRGSVLSIDEEHSLSNDLKRLSVSLVSGQLHIVKRNTAHQEYRIFSAPWAVRVTEADISVCTDTVTPCRVIMLGGFATFSSEKSAETVIPSCSRLCAYKNGLPELESLNEEDILSIKSWVGSTVVEEAVSNSGCRDRQGVAVNEPPRWIRLPGKSAVLGESFEDTVEAVDPEGSAVTYSLCKAPAGMTIDATSGVITYTADSAGEHSIIITASDENSAACTADVVISVSSSFSLRLVSPQIVQPGKPVSVTALTKGCDRKKIRFRFDMDGDGKIDFPVNGKFGAVSGVKRYVYTKEGVFQIKAEAQLDYGRIVSVRRTIIVNAPPKAVLKVSPRTTEIGIPVEIDISESIDIRNREIPLKARFDINGDGIWDIPEGNGFLTTSKIIYAWDKPGIYTVAAQVVDRDGASDIASVRVTVRKGMSGGTLECRDSLHVGDTLKITCMPPADGFRITEFAWSFDGDTVYEKKSTVAEVKTVFKNAGKANIICRLTDENGRRSTLFRQVTVVNSPAKVVAGGPYKCMLNKAIELKGWGEDPDNRIIRYLWDMDGDGKADWVSDSGTKATFTYRKPRTFRAVFCVETDDGRNTCDTAQVEVVNSVPKVYAGEDIVSKKNRRIRLYGKADDEDGIIALYAWDFDGDGKIDWKSTESGITEWSFQEYTNAIFRAYDSEGDSATDTIRIIICPDDMRTIEKGKYCIDEYEFPNRAGGKPSTEVSYDEAVRLCKNAGKRLCTEKEWKTACSWENENYNYPYGTDYNEGKCNTLGNPRLKNRVASSGYFTECKSWAGVFDMSGNVAEWVESEDGSFYAYGGSWQNGREGSDCNSKIKLKRSGKYFYVGFRCCK